AQLRASEGDALSRAAPLEMARRRDSMVAPAERTLEGVPAADDSRLASKLAPGTQGGLLRRRHFALRPGVVITLETEGGTTPSPTSAPARRREAVSDEVATDSVASGGVVITTIRWTDSVGVRISLSGPVGRDELLALRRRVR
nr:hypothetical protein [Gemmatimonadota bacterium]